VATTTAGPDPILAASVRTPHVPATRLVLGLPIPAAILAVALLAVGVMAAGYVLAVPFDTAAFGGLTVPTVVLSGVADGFNPCAFALLVLFATYTLTLVNAVTSDGTPTVEARRRLLAPDPSTSARVGHLLHHRPGPSLLPRLDGARSPRRPGGLDPGPRHGLWMLKDVLLPGWAPR